MAALDAMIAQLRSLNQPVPKPGRLPNEDEVRAIEALTGVSFPSDFRRYLLEASDIVFDIEEPVTVTNPAAHTYFPKVLASARAYGVPVNLIPLCEDDADFYCVASSGEVVFWSHDRLVDERWPSIAAWIEEVWIGESDL